MAEKFTTADYLQAAEIMARTTSKNIDYAVYFLRKAGLCDEEFEALIANGSEEKKPCARGRKKNVDQEVIDALNDLEARGDFDIFAIYLKEVFKIPKARLKAWKNGDSGISEETKKILMKEINDRRNYQESLGKTLAMRLTSAKHPEEPSP